MLRSLGLTIFALILGFLIETPLLMLALGGLHHYWPLIPALGYGALFFLSVITILIAVFTAVGKVLGELIVE
jgi:hypothetical protein